jgi:hypothetical protein
MGLLCGFGVVEMMSAGQEIGMILGIDAEARRLERERVLVMFASLAEQMDTKADEDDGDIGLVWTAAAACIRRVCDEAKSA